MAAPVSRRALLEEGRSQLAAAGIETPARDARLLVLAALGLEQVALVTDPDQIVELAQLETARALFARRAGHEPVGRILGEREFRGLRFKLSPGTLEPRPDSEVVVEAALEAVICRKAAALRMLDLGSGSGCLLIALLDALPHATGTGIDQSADAVATARTNAALNGVAARSTFVEGDWLAGVNGPFDLVISNPPYIRHADKAGLAPEVHLHDPEAALDGGVDGLDPYRVLAPGLPAVLAPDAVVILEIGAGQAAEVTKLFVSAGFENTATKADLGGHIRALVFRLSTDLRVQVQQRAWRWQQKRLLHHSRLRRAATQIGLIGCVERAWALLTISRRGIVLNESASAGAWAPPDCRGSRMLRRKPCVTSIIGADAPLLFSFPSAVTARQDRVAA